MRELSMHILDVLENAHEAGATLVELEIEEDTSADRLTIVVRDNGRGMDAETAKRALDPFFTTRTTRHVGLGLPLFAEAARRCDGDLTIQSTPGEGTTITATFRHSHIDRAPLGRIVDTLIAFLLSDPPVDLIYRHRVDEHTFTFDTREWREALGELPFSHPRVRSWIRHTLEEGEASLYRSGGDEHAQAEEH